MKLLITVLIIAILSSCNNKTTDPVFEGFRLGEKIDMRKIETKFGPDNTLNKYITTFKSIGIDARISLGDYGNNTWNYKFSNGLNGFVTFVDTDSILTQIVLQVGEMDQIFPNRKGYDDLYHIKEKVSESGIQFLKASLKKKYGVPTDSISMIMEPDVKKIIWQFKKYQIHFQYNNNTYSECKIRYVLDWDIVDEIEKEKRKKELNKQSDNL